MYIWQYLKKIFCFSPTIFAKELAHSPNRFAITLQMQYRLDFPTNFKYLTWIE